MRKFMLALARATGYLLALIGALVALLWAPAAIVMLFMGIWVDFRWALTGLAMLALATLVAFFALVWIVNHEEHPESRIVLDTRQDQS